MLVRCIAQWRYEEVAVTFSLGSGEKGATSCHDISEALETIDLSIAPDPELDEKTPLD